MRVKDIEEAKEKLEVVIYEAVRTAMNEFEAETGKSPDDIQIHLEQRQTIGCADTKYLIAIRATVTI